MRIKVRRARASTALGGGLGLALLAISGLATAQGGPGEAVPESPDPATAEPTEAASGSDGGTITVTGSRIAKPDFSFSNPVVTVGAEALQRSGSVSLTNVLATIPSLAGSFDSNDVAGANAGVGETGLERLNLRNLGADRTLVLVNGRRHVAASPGSVSVDIDTIPEALIERVEVQTGGASAIYGADGVSGVVNFITKRDFEGLDFRAQRGVSDRKDGDTSLLSLVAGHNFLDNAANLTLALEYAQTKRIRGTARRSGKPGYRVLTPNPADGTGAGDDPAIPDRIFVGDIRWIDSAPGGAYDVDGDFVADFNADGSPFNPGIQSPNNFFTQIGGDGTPTAGYDGDLIPREERYTLNLFSQYEFSNKTRAFAEFKYSASQAYSQGQPTFEFFTLLAPDYAYTPASIAAAAQDAIDAGLNDGTLVVNRDNFDLGRRADDIDRDTVRSVVGLEGDLTPSLHFETSLVYGRTKVDARTLNNRYEDRFYAGIDAVRDSSGNIVCRSDLDPAAVPYSFFPRDSFTPRPGTWAGSFNPGPGSGCQPINLFGNGAISQAARDFVLTDSLEQATIEQTVFQAFVTGSGYNWFVPGGEELKYVLGFERRLESSKDTPAREDQLGHTFGNAIQPTKGQYDVTEVFAELNVPLVTGKPLMESWSVDGAVRFSDYNLAGSTRTWKYGTSYVPVDGLRLRGTRAKATRAPNIGELFEPGSQTFLQVEDPCAAVNVGSGTGFRADNCRSLLLGLGVADPDTYVDLNQASISGTQLGNRDLKPEDADTITYGIVISPPSIPGLSFSVDWYDISLKNAINFASAQEAADLCVDSPTLANPFCGLITRDQGTGTISNFIQQPVNVAQFDTKGYDFNLVYSFRPKDYGVITTTLVASKLQQLTFVNLPGAPPDRDKGEPDAPEWQATLGLSWEVDKWSVGYGAAYFDKTSRIDQETRQNNPDRVDKRYYFFSDKLTHDAYLGYELSEGLSLYSGINNFTDERPDPGESGYPVSPVGRFFFAGLNWTH